jgi:hypothetical protein
MFKRTIEGLLVMLMICGSAFAIPVGIDNFEDGTTQGWFVPGPHPAPPTNISTGGPAGAGDNYLRVNALGGDGPGSRLSVQNFSQWSGDLTSFSRVTMDVNNFGPDDLFLRFLFVNFSGDPGLSPPSDVAWSLTPVIVPSGSGWLSVVFDISPANLFAPVGSIAGALGGVDEAPALPQPSRRFLAVQRWVLHP